MYVKCDSKFMTMLENIIIASKIECGKLQKQRIGDPFSDPCVPQFAASLALGTCPWVARGVIRIIFLLNSDAILVTFGTYANQLVTKCQSIQDRIHSCLE